MKTRLKYLKVNGGIKYDCTLRDKLPRYGLCWTGWKSDSKLSGPTSKQLLVVRLTVAWKDDDYVSCTTSMLHTCLTLQIWICITGLIKTYYLSRGGVKIITSRFFITNFCNFMRDSDLPFLCRLCYLNSCGRLTL